MAAALRSLGTSLAIVAAIFGVIFATRGCATQKVTFFDLRVLNDTHREVRVVQCWDLDCIDTHGLRSSVVRPGHSVHEDGHFLTDAGRVIVVGIRKPGGNRWQFAACMPTAFATGQKTGLVRVSHAQACFTGPE